jgi:hypothetical protein
MASLPLQQGGVISSFHLIMNNLDSPSKLLYGFVLVLLIVYSPLIPSSYRSFANSPLGRIIGLAFIYFIIESFGWVYGLLTAMAFLVMLYGSTTSEIEGFDGGGSVSEKKKIGKRWFVEKVLGEHPDKIATDRVTTQAIQD